MDIENNQPADGGPALALAADVVLIGLRDLKPYVLLLRRGWEPEKGKLALPGGQINWAQGERAEEAARRELKEETGIDAPDFLVPLWVFDHPDRDPRGRMISFPFLAVLDQTPPVHVVDPEEASEVDWYLLDDILKDPHGLAFDHILILQHAMDATEGGMAVQSPRRPA